MKTKKDFIEYGKQCKKYNNYAAIVHIQGKWQKEAFEYGYAIG